MKIFTIMMIITYLFSKQKTIKIKTKMKNRLQKTLSLMGVFAMLLATIPQAGATSFQYPQNPNGNLPDQ